MRFSRPVLPSPDTALHYLAAADRAAVAVGRGVVLLAFAGVIATGLYLAFHAPGGAMLPYGAMRGLHWLLGLLLLITLAWRLCEVLAWLWMAAAALRRGSRRPPKWPGATGPELALSLAFWIVLAAVALSGAEAALASRYGVSLLPGWLPLPWVRFHAIATWYLLAILLLRGFLWVRALLAAALPYLRSP